MATFSWSEVTTLEDRVKSWMTSRRTLIESLRSRLQISANPTFHVEGRRKARKAENLLLDRLQREELRLVWGQKKLPYGVILALACQSWFYPDDLRSAVQFLILDQRMRFNLSHPELDLVLKGKGYCILWLQEQVYNKGWRWLFGGIFTDSWTMINHYGKSITYKLEEVLPYYKWFRKKIPTPTQRKRGYRDHGSLKELDRKAREEEISKDFTMNLEEELIEARRKQADDTRRFLEGWFS